MRDDQPLLVRLLLTIFGTAIGGIGSVLWLVGRRLSLVLGLVLACPLDHYSHGYLWFIAILTACSILLPAIGSAMEIFMRPIAEERPLGVPADLLPRWWVMRFMLPLCFVWSFLFPIAAATNLVLQHFQGLLYLPGAAAAIFGLRYFSVQERKLSSPQSPDPQPGFWKTRF